MNHIETCDCCHDEFGMRNVEWTGTQFLCEKCRSENMNTAEMIAQTRADEPEIKPCPFCGEQPKVIKRKWTDLIDAYWVFCQNGKCEAHMECSYSEVDAIAKWNRRAK